MPCVCPDCGAAALKGRTCQDLLHILLEKTSLTDAAEYGLAVACYTLQHASRQSDKTLEWAYFHVIEAVQSKLPLGEIRQRVRSRFDQDRYHIAVESLRPTLTDISWRVNIRDLEVIEGDTDAERTLVWARLVIEDINTHSKPLLSIDRGKCM